MKKLSIITLCALLTMLYAGCSHDTDVFDGPALNDIYGPFFIVDSLEISDYNANFAAGDKPIFSVTYSKNVNWTLHITGLTSGAVKQYSALSNQLNASNATWDGSTTTMPLFRAEQCAVMVTVENETDTLRDTLTVVEPKVNEGLLVADFENGYHPIWSDFVQAGATVAISDQLPQAEGTHVLDMSGAVNWDWLIGMIHFPAQSTGSLTYALPENPDNVWFNALLYKPDTINNALVLFQFREDEDGDGTGNEAQEDMWSYELSPEEEGWQLISVPYSELVSLANGAPVPANGNNLREPHKLSQISVLMLADPTSGYSRALLDYVIFTEGGPLAP